MNLSKIYNFYIQEFNQQNFLILVECDVDKFSEKHQENFHAVIEL